MFSNPPIALTPHVFILKHYADTTALQVLIHSIAAQAPFRHMLVPGGAVMKVALSNCGDFGWTSDAAGYRYAALDPASGLPWPAMPPAFAKLGRDAAKACGFEAFEPNACLVNRYVGGAGVGLHQDKNERDFTQPIVSVSIGAPCSFVLGGLERGDATRSIRLEDGDVMVWGDTARLVYHGVRPLPKGSGVRHNITLRRAC